MQLNGKRVLVIGGAGNIGSHLVDNLVAKNNQVTVLDNFSVGARWKIAHHGDKVSILEVDVRDRQKMFDVVKDFDQVYYLACQVLRASFEDTPLVYDVCSTGHVNAIEACRRNNIND